MNSQPAAIKARPHLFMVALALTTLACELEPGTRPPINDHLDQQKLVNLVNHLRSEDRFCGETFHLATTPIRWNHTLAAVAQAHSHDMNDNDFFSHRGSDGSDPGERMTQAGYDWRAYGENIAKGYSSETTVIKGWLDSPGHCRSLMNSNFTEMGVGEVNKHWTQVFGSPL